MAAKPLGASYGIPGGSLHAGAAWAVNDDVAAMGKSGEEATAAILVKHCLTPGGATVFHDLSVPGSTANIDHLVVAGRTVWMVDAKRWKPGFYIKLGARVYRFHHGDGVERFAPAEKSTMVMAGDRLTRWLAGRGIRFRFRPSTVVVWPSSQSVPLRMWAARSMPGARLVSPDQFSDLASRRCRGTADPALVAALMPLVREDG